MRRDPPWIGLQNGLGDPGFGCGAHEIHYWNSSFKQQQTKKHTDGRRQWDGKFGQAID
eukprot:CAMPEP_0174383696 /NCGR_PEP_ID=MMETSP0811_2-20130205/125366_1 /TAXON_ID=73025 ORGANISM="Eutreptiella gymnastica-like, Strain CCMP1594" /NCGR_SAMPLE_ID=MMETSP0811_2 /ASSEMBLY_ACC=CAM_ASM_000667 /LENGTH=57 /DNA_ID=CAMNT_0015537389 /DNA_START=2315 /DNA_END=2485 /DNA_ORIENTATION=+